MTLRSSNGAAQATAAALAERINAFWRAQGLDPECRVVRGDNFRYPTGTSAPVAALVSNMVDGVPRRRWEGTR